MVDVDPSMWHHIRWCMLALLTSSELRDIQGGNT
jgi:hypothetical protein